MVKDINILQGNFSLSWLPKFTVSYPSTTAVSDRSKQHILSIILKIDIQHNRVTVSKHKQFVYLIGCCNSWRNLETEVCTQGGKPDKRKPCRCLEGTRQENTFSRCLEEYKDW